MARAYPAARKVLEFLAQIADLQGGVDRDNPLEALPGLVSLMLAGAPAKLAAAARDLDREACQAAMDDYLLGGDTTSPRSFFARVLLQPVKFGALAHASESSATCPCCAHSPQTGVLEQLGHGQALWLHCSLCFHRWEFPRGRCIACGQTDTRKLAFFRAEELPHIHVMTCDECRRYIHLIDAEREPRAVADIDEVAALPLDVWAIERGFSKIQPNLAGI